MRFPFRFKYINKIVADASPIAQLVERLTVNAKVWGSIPIWWKSWKSFHCTWCEIFLNFPSNWSKWVPKWRPFTTAGFFPNLEKCNRMDLVSKWRKFSPFSVPFQLSRSKWVPKWRPFTISGFYEFRKMQSNGPSVKMTKIFTIFSSFSTKLVKMVCKILWKKVPNWWKWVPKFDVLNFVNLLDLDGKWCWLMKFGLIKFFLRSECRV